MKDEPLIWALLNFLSCYMHMPCKFKSAMNCQEYIEILVKISITATRIPFPLNYFTANPATRNLHWHENRDRLSISDAPSSTRPAPSIILLSSPGHSLGPDPSISNRKEREVGHKSYLFFFQFLPFAWPERQRKKERRNGGRMSQMGEKGTSRFFYA